LPGRTLSSEARANLRRRLRKKSEGQMDYAIVCRSPVQDRRIFLLEEFRLLDQQAVEGRKAAFQSSENAAVEVFIDKQLDHEMISGAA
jgi:hypothetical protein